MSDNDVKLTEDSFHKAQVVDVDIEKEMKQSFLAYSMSVIVSRALPDVRDGLKPVHRRILYTLFENGVTPDKAYRKCADTVGAVLGRYHPHGDTSIYDALVRMAQDFSMRYTLVDGHGNFGSVDGDPPAAYRYTEARMSKISTKMLTDIEKNTVDFIPNYDDRLKEPVVLPTGFPNLLVNGSTGIAVGMATNIPPHNMREVVNAMCALIDNPDITLDGLMKHIKGPDFPTAGLIMGLSGIREAYATGRGKITVRARTEIVESNSKNKIIITELPYQVNKARLIESIADLVKDKKIDGISNIDDHSDRNGMHIEIDLKRDAIPNIVLNKLFGFTQMQVTFGAIMLSIVNGEPKILTLKEMLNEYVNFRVGVIKRRTEFDLNKAKERVHILEGLKIAIDNIEEVIKVIRSSQSIPEAKKLLIERFNIDEVQTQAIVQMPLGRLTGLERNKIEDEINDLLIKIADWNDIICNTQRLLTIVKEEAIAISNKYGDERKTEIMPASGELDIEDLIPNEECVVTYTNYGYIKRQKLDNYKLQKRGGRGVSGMSRRNDDIVTEMFITHTHDDIMFFSSIGKAYRFKCYEIAEGSKNSKGTNIANILTLEKDEKITAMVTVPENSENEYLLMLTKKGIIKRTLLSSFDRVKKNGVIAIELDEGDDLHWVKSTDGDRDIFIATRDGKAIMIKESNIRSTGRKSRGIKALSLRESDEVVGVCLPEKDKLLLTVSENGYGRLTKVDEYRVQSRGGQGSNNYPIKKGGNVAAVDVVDKNDDLIIISSNGVIIRIETDSIRECSRTSKGVKLMRLSDNNKVIAIAKVSNQIEDDDDKDIEED